MKPFADGLILAMGLTVLISAGPLEGQVLNTPRLSATNDPGVYEQLLIGSRARHFQGQVSPSGELYFHIDDYDLQSADAVTDFQELSPNLTDIDGVRKISVAVVTHVPQNVRVHARQGEDLEIGVVHLPEERGVRRPVEINAFIDLAPLQIRGTGGATRERFVDETGSFLGGNDRDH